MILLFEIYLIGVAFAYIAALCEIAKKQGEITIGDLLICLLVSISSWFLILSYLTEKINWKATVWKRKSKEEKDDNVSMA